MAAVAAMLLLLLRLLMLRRGAGRLSRRGLARPLFTALHGFALQPLLVEGPH